MEDSERDKGLEKKIKYVRPELISLDKDKGVEGQNGCENGSSANDCGHGGSPVGDDEGV